MAEQKMNLFSEFPPISTAEWEAVIKADLEGAEYEKKLIWKTLEGFDVKPYYRNEAIENLPQTEILPNEFPYLRGNREKNNAWEIRQDIKVGKFEEANQKAIDALRKGATSVGFIFNDNPTISDEDFSTLLKDIDFSKVELNFIARHGVAVLFPLLEKEMLSRKVSFSALRGSITLDAIGYASLTGNFCISEKDVFDRITSVTKDIIAKFPNLRILAINGHIFHNSGATAVQELAFSFSKAVEYLSQLTDRGLSVDQIAPKMTFIFSVGSNYFMEIAKIRAARLLWAKIIELYKPKSMEAAKMFIHSVTSEWNKTIYDPYMNLLRSTTEAMSAVVGGTDSLTVQPFDIAYKNSDEFSDRISRNTQIILKEEANLDKVIDASAGSYYIESLTNSIAAETLKLFQNVESKGGYLAAFKEGFIQTQIEEVAKKRDMNLAQRREIMVGTNQYPNFSEKVASNIDFSLLNVSIPEREDKMARSLKPYRGAKSFELLRLKTEQHSFTPRVYLFTFGNVAMRKARAMFSANFFGCAGFEVIESQGFANIEEGIQETLKISPNIVVLCSSDDEYEQLVPAVFEVLKEKTIIVVAGYPTKILEKLNALGVKNYIHIKSNLLETLQMFQKELGIS